MKSDKSNRDKQMAAHLKATGYPHGRRRSSTLAPPVPNRDDVGSAAQRRRVAKGRV
jgi:hypothetical protein